MTDIPIIHHHLYQDIYSEIYNQNNYRIMLLFLVVEVLIELYRRYTYLEIIKKKKTSIASLKKILLHAI